MNKVRILNVRVSALRGGNLTFLSIFLQFSFDKKCPFLAHSTDGYFPSTSFNSSLSAFVHPLRYFCTSLCYNIHSVNFIDSFSHTQTERDSHKAWSCLLHIMQSWQKSFFFIYRLKSTWTNLHTHTVMGGKWREHVCVIGTFLCVAVSRFHLLMMVIMMFGNFFSFSFMVGFCAADIYMVWIQTFVCFEQKFLNVKLTWNFFFRKFLRFVLTHEQGIFLNLKITKATV